MANIERSIDVDVPVRAAYDQWTQFEEFPSFMEGVEEIRQIDDTHTHWRTKVAGREKEFDAVVTEQRPDERIAWTSQDGPEHAGVVTFHHLADAKTRVMLQLDYEPVLYLCSPDGVIRDRLDVIWDQSEVDARLDAFLS